MYIDPTPILSFWEVTLLFIGFLTVGMITMRVVDCIKKRKNP